jgi:hypothetical protein
MHNGFSVLTLAALMLAGLALSACDQNEQGRITTYQKGTYLGRPDTRLKSQQVDLLRQRAAQQAGI